MSSLTFYFAGPNKPSSSHFCLMIVLPINIVLLFSDKNYIKSHCWEENFHGSLGSFPNASENT